MADAIRAIDNTITAFKENIKPYMGQIFQFCKNSIDKQPSDDSEIKPLIYDVLVSLVIKLKSEAPDPNY